MNENKINRLFTAAKNEMPPAVPEGFSRDVTRSLRAEISYSLWDQLAALFPKLAGVALLVIGLAAAGNFYLLQDEASSGGWNQTTEQLLFSGDNHS